MKLLRRFHWVFLLLVLGLLSFASSGMAQDDDELEELTQEAVKCKPDTIITGYEKFKSDTISDQQVAIWYSFGQEDYKYKHYEKAIPYFWKVAMNDRTGKFKVVYSKLADSYYRLGKRDSVLLAAYAGLQRFPDYARLHFWAGFVHDQLGQIQCAIPHYEFMVKKYPKRKEYWAKLAYLYYKMDDPKAIEAQQKVVELDPNDLEAGRLLAEIMNHFGEDPLKALEDLFRKDPSNVENAMRFGKEAYNAGEYDKAIEAFQAVLKQDSKNVTALEYLGRSYEGLSRYNEAIRTYKQILKINPKNVKIMSLIASVYTLKNDFVSAMTYVNKAKRIDPNNGLPYMIAAEVYEAAVTYCSNKRGKREFTYDDKLVYKRAADEYRKAMRDPNYASDAKKRLNQLANLVPTKEDYFLHSNRMKPKDKCYSWIK